MDPGEAGPTRPQPVRLNQKTAAIFPTIGAMITSGFIRIYGELLHQLGYVDETYVDAMQEREKLITTYMGMGVAIPHGTSQAKGTVKKTGIVFLQYPQGVDFGDEKAQLVFGIAGIGEEHLNLLAKICEVLEDEEVLEKMKTTDDIDWIMEWLS